MVAALLLLAAGCARPAPGAPEPQPGGPPPAPLPAEFDPRASEANRVHCDSVLEREYTPALRSAGIEGVAQVWMLVDTVGIVREVRIGESSGHAELDDIALRVARCRRFVPAVRRDVPVSVWLALPFAFRAR